MNRRIGRHQRIVYFAIVAIERQVVELGRNWLASRPAKGDLQRVGTHYFKAQRALILTDAIECSAIGMRNRLGGHENVLQQPVYIRLIGKRGANTIELLEAPKQISHRIHSTHSYFMQTERTCLMSVMPDKIFSIPSIFNVRMPSLMAVAKSSATRACS